VELNHKKSGNRRAETNRSYQSSLLVKDHSERHANQIIEAAMTHFELTEEQLRTPKQGDLTRAAIATRAFKETTVSQSWIARQLGISSAPAVCQQIRRYKMLPPKIKKWKNV
ncbi:MAG: hypothetical protein P1V19_23705, partial [Gimesia sp.]|nr:hypothetical protein [Gimesia sp.]